jgi:hypothetical protein
VVLVEALVEHVCRREGMEGGSKSFAKIEVSPDNVISAKLNF